VFSSDAKSARRRHPALVPVSNLVLGLVILIGGSVLLFAVAGISFQSRTGLETAAAAMIVLGLAITGASLRPAYDLLRSSKILSRETAEPERVAFKLFEPAGRHMALDDAVRRAYAETQGTAAATFASAYGTGPDDICTMYATFFAEHVAIHGCRQPTDVLEEVTLTNPPKEFLVESGSLILKERDGDAVYTDLCISAADYPVVFSRILSAPY
jgi:hypothetical protein